MVWTDYILIFISVIFLNLIFFAIFHLSCHFRQKDQNLKIQSKNTIGMRCFCAAKAHKLVDKSEIYLGSLVIKFELFLILYIHSQQTKKRR